MRHLRAPFSQHAGFNSTGRVAGQQPAAPLTARCRRTARATAAAAAAPARQLGRLPARGRTSALTPLCMQAGGRPPAPQGPYPPAPATAALAPRAGYAPVPQQPVFLDLSQVLGKTVITRTSGRALGSLSACWVDPGRREVASFDLDDRRGGAGGSGGAAAALPRVGGAARVGNLPLSALRQIGDVVLVHDEGGLYEPDLDGRLGYVNPIGLEVRTAAGDLLGRVRDLSFSPDNGAIGRLAYDEFGLPSLPAAFFDTYSVGADDILSIGRSEVIVYDDARYRERKESSGLFAAIPSLLKSLGGGSGSRPGGQLALPAAGMSEAYRDGAGGYGGASSPAGYLPRDYTYEQWQADLRRWEAETGMTYEQYLRASAGGAPGAAGGARAALPPARGAAAPAGAGGYGAGYAPRGAPAAGGYGAAAAPPRGAPAAGPGPRYAPQPGPGGRPAAAPQQQGYGPGPSGYGAPPAPRQQQQQQQQQQQAGWAADPRQRPYGAAPPPQQQQAPRPAAQAYGAPPAAGQQAPPPQQQQQQAWAAAGAPRTPTARAPAGGEQPSAQAGAGAAGRPVEEWIDRDARPRVQEVLAEGALPIGSGAPAAGGPAPATDGASSSGGTAGPDGVRA